MSTTVNSNAEFYSALVKNNRYEPALDDCIKNTVAELLEHKTTDSRPGMLLGKIQSGKTRTFIGVIALAFDNGYDVALILTKNNVALVQQTYERLAADFDRFVDADKLQIFDIMSLPKDLTKFQLKQKVILVIKKETHNLEHLEAALHSSYPILKRKKILIIDDEADLASVGFRRTHSEGLELRKIAKQIDQLRKSLGVSDFLQVTATPYSLYLQPEDLVIGEANKYCEPTRPSFTKLAPEGQHYIGGEYYFEESQEQDRIASYLHEPVLAEELDVLKRSDRRKFKLEHAITSPKIKSIRHAVINFVVGGTIRRIQDGADKKKYSFIIHTDSHRDAHDWQLKIVTELCIGSSKMRLSLTFS